MKKILNVLLSLMLCLGLVACGSDSVSDNNNTQQNLDTEVNGDKNSNDSLNDAGTLDESFSQFIGVWYSYHNEGNLIEIYEDGRIMLNDSVEYTAKNFDGEMFEVYLGDKWCGNGYINEDFSEPDNPWLDLETPENLEIIGGYTRNPK